MGEIKPTEKQGELIKSKDGIYLVDAGPGTGKTFTITQRYIHLLKDESIEPENVLLLTFTENAAEQMKKKVIVSSDYNPAKLRDAPISTFHSHCKKILDLYGFNAPQFLGINDGITSSIKIMENEALEAQYFQQFFYTFIENSTEHNDFFPVFSNHRQLLSLIKNLSAKGIFPTKNDWYQNSENYLKGDFEHFKELFKIENAPRGENHSKLKSLLNSYGKDKCYLKNAPTKNEIRGPSKTPQIDDVFAERSFNEDRDALIKFIHDVYFAYIEYALSRNYLNFSFLIMFTYFLLCEDHEIRKESQFEYVMVDEFQDTNEIQFKLVLLLSKNGNIFVVGDWKQSIYGFQYATVENIQNFNERLKQYREELNKDFKRIEYSVNKVINKELDKNHRSIQKIIDFSEQSLIIKAIENEIIDSASIQENITHLQAVRDNIDTKIEVIANDNEFEAILTKIKEIVNNPEYKIEDENKELRLPNYGDIAILTRTRKFGIELQKVARKYGIPVSYEAGIELFKTDPAILLLAWLRILNDKKSLKGWAVILEEADYVMDEIKNILSSHHYPLNMTAFKEELLKNEEISTIARRVFEKYGINNGYTDKIIEVLQGIFNDSFMKIGDFVQFIVNNIEAGNTYVIDSGTKKNIVKIQTIHAAKGLEYPIVFISDINLRRFPSSKSDVKFIIYDDTIGLRQKRIYSEDPRPYVYDNWKTEILTKTISKDYDEDRRLFYVAITRARDHLFLTSNTRRSSSFFKDLEGVETVEIVPHLEVVEKPFEEEINVLEIETPKSRAPIKLSVHAIMDKVSGTEGEGSEYGTKVHKFAELYANREEVEPENVDEENTKKFIDDLKGDLITEKFCLLPFEINGAGTRKIVLNGIIDLIHILGEEIQIIDYKTDRNKKGEKEYRKQLSVYYHVLNELYPEKKVTSNIFYTYKGELCQINPLSIEELKKILSDRV